MTTEAQNPPQKFSPRWFTGRLAFPMRVRTDWSNSTATIKAPALTPWDGIRRKNIHREAPFGRWRTPDILMIVHIGPRECSTEMVVQLQWRVEVHLRTRLLQRFPHPRR